MKINVVGGGPAGLYAAILMKGARQSHEITVYERNRPDDTFGFGVVFSDATMAELGDAEPYVYREIAAAFAHWDDIDIHYGGRVLASGGHGFAGLSRMRLLQILQRRAEHLGVPVHFETEVGDLEACRDADVVLAADGVNSLVRERYAEHFGPSLDFRPNRFVWLGTTRPFDAFTFYFRENEHGLWRVHAYQYEEGKATFIVEAREDTWVASGLAVEDEDATARFCEELFAEELGGHPLLKNRSHWRRFPTVTNAAWSHENVVLMGDAAHTAHFSVGSGTRIAMLDGIALTEALERESNVACALAAYEEERRGPVESPPARGASEPSMVRGYRALHASRAYAVRVYAAHPQPFASPTRTSDFGTMPSSAKWTHGLPERPRDRAGRRCASILHLRPCSRRSAFGIS